MPKVILHVLPAPGEPDPMIGRDPVAYQRMLDDLVELATAADDLGYWGLSHAEGHLHAGSFELSPSPLLLDVFLGQRTRRIRHGQLGLVLPGHDPLRLAAETALADQMLKGRFFVGMARGHHAPWTDTLCQKYGVAATLADGGEADERNRLLFTENARIVRLAWERDLLAYDGPTYQVPYPYDATGGVPVVPRPYSGAQPMLFQAWCDSPETLTWCGEQGVAALLGCSPIEVLPELADVYRAGAASAGRQVERGEGLGVCRAFHVVDDHGGRRGEDSALAEVLDRTRVVDSPAWDGLYRGLHPAMGPGPLDGRRAGGRVAQRLLDGGALIGGTVDMVRRRLAVLLDALPAEYLVWPLHWGAVPRSDALRSLELFATRVLPEFDFTEIPASTSARG